MERSELIMDVTFVYSNLTQVVMNIRMSNHLVMSYLMKPSKAMSI